MDSKLWNILFSQAIPFFIMLYLTLNLLINLWSLLLCSIPLSNGTVNGAEYAISLAKELNNGMWKAITAYVFSRAADHWLYDHYKMDSDSNPPNPPRRNKTN